MSRMLRGLPIALLIGWTSAVAAQTRAHIGPRIGVNFDSDDLLIGAQFTAPLGSRLEFYPSVDIYFPNRGTSLGFNTDLKVLFPTRSAPQFYAGGGLNIAYRSVNSVSNTDLGANLIGGVESRRGQVHPFIEGRVLFHDNSAFQLVGGLNITLGRH